MRERPPREVLDAFGAAGELVPLPGGKGTVWRAGVLVLKPLDMAEEELEWQAAVLAALDGAEDVRVAPPVRTIRGDDLIVQGWTAWRFEPGSPPTAGQYRDVIAAGRAFSRRLAGLARPAFLDRRNHPWSVADRVAWGDRALDDGAHPPHVEELLRARGPVRAAAQLVHGDLTDNVHLHPHLPPLVIDLSPYWRPPSYATAVVAVDAVVFRGAGLCLLDEVRAEEDEHFPQMLVRALLFRAVADHLIAPERDEEWGRWFGPTVRAVTALTR